jgi:hypothetical protein
MPTTELLEDRIVELVFCPWSELPAGLNKLGLKTEVTENGEAIIIDNGYQKHGMTDIDPPTKAVVISAALSGCFRVGHFFPGLMPKIHQRWKRFKS